MIPQHRFVVDDTVVEQFASRTQKERGELLRIFSELAMSPYKSGEWQQRTTGGRQVQVTRFGRWLVRYWLDEPALEVRIIDVEKLS